MIRVLIRVLIRLVTILDDPRAAVVLGEHLHEHISAGERRVAHLLARCERCELLRRQAAQRRAHEGFARTGGDAAARGASETAKAGGRLLDDGAQPTVHNPPTSPPHECQAAAAHGERKNLEEVERRLVINFHLYLGTYLVHIQFGGWTAHHSMVAMLLRLSLALSLAGWIGCEPSALEVPQQIPSRALIVEVITGGQTGSDRGAWDAALAAGVAISGWVPLGRWAEDGGVPAAYGELRETTTDDPAERTEANVLEADAVVVVTNGALRGGSKLAAELAEKHGKMWLHMDLFRMAAASAEDGFSADVIAEASSIVRLWLDRSHTSHTRLSDPSHTHKYVSHSTFPTYWVPITGISFLACSWQDGGHFNRCA